MCVFGNALCRESVFCLETEFSISLLRMSGDCMDCIQHSEVDWFYRGADRSLARPGRKQATATRF